MKTDSPLPNSDRVSGCPTTNCYAVFIRKAGNWIQESVLFDSYADAQAHAKLTRHARQFVEMTRVRRISPNTPAHSPPPVDPRFARFGEAMWKYIIKRGGDFCRDEISEDILPLAEAARLCCRVKYDPKIHGEMIDAEPGCEIWWWGNF